MLWFKADYLCALVLFLSCAHCWKPNVHKICDRVFIAVYKSVSQIRLCLRRTLFVIVTSVSCLNLFPAEGLRGAVCCKQNFLMRN